MHAQVLLVPAMLAGMAVAAPATGYKTITVTSAGAASAYTTTIATPKSNAKGTVEIVTTPTPSVPTATFTTTTGSNAISTITTNGDVEIIWPTMPNTDDSGCKTASYTWGSTPVTTGNPTYTQVYADAGTMVNPNDAVVIPGYGQEYPSGGDVCSLNWCFSLAGGKYPSFQHVYDAGLGNWACLIHNQTLAASDFTYADSTIYYAAGYNVVPTASATPTS